MRTREKEKETRETSTEKKVIRKLKRLQFRSEENEVEVVAATTTAVTAATPKTLNGRLRCASVMCILCDLFGPHLCK